LGTVLGHIKKDELLVTGIYNERMPVIANGLTSHFPLDSKGGTFDAVGGYQPIQNTLFNENLVDCMDMDWRNPNKWTCASGSISTVTYDLDKDAIRIQGNHYLWLKTPLIVDINKTYKISCEIYQENDEWNGSSANVLYLGGTGNTFAGTKYTTNYDYSIQAGVNVPLGQWITYSKTRSGSGSYPSGWTSTNGLCYKYYFGGLFNYSGGANSVLYIRNIIITVLDSDNSTCTFTERGVYVEESTTNLVTNGDYAGMNVGEALGVASWGGNVGNARYTNEVPMDIEGMSMRFECTVALGGGAYVDNDVNVTLVDGTTYTVSYYARAREKITVNGYLASLNRNADNAYITSGDEVIDINWKRYSYTFTANSSMAGVYRFRHLLYVAGCVYITGLQIEARSYKTSFVKGSRSKGYLSIPNVFGASGGSISLWAECTVLDNTNYRSLYGNEWSNNAFFLFIEQISAGGHLYGYYPNTSSAHTWFSTSYIPVYGDGEHNFVVTWDSSALSVYKDGVYIGGSGAGANNIDCGRIATTITQLYIGCHPGYLNYGKVRGLSIYNRPLTANEVRQSYNAMVEFESDGDVIARKISEPEGYLERDMGSYFFNTGNFADGWISYVQASCNVYSSGCSYVPESNYSYFIKRDPNLTFPASGNIMWGGFRVLPPESVKKAGTWEISFYYRGHTGANSPMEVYSSYEVGWPSNGVGLYAPFVTSIPAFDTGDEWKKFSFIYTITDADIKQKGTNDVIYDCMRQIKIGFGYNSTDGIGTRVFIDRVDIKLIDESVGFKKDRVVMRRFEEGIINRRIYILGTSEVDSNGLDIGGNRIIRIDGVDTFVGAGRGLMLNIFDATLTQVFSNVYDVYIPGTYRNDLATKLATIRENQYWCLTSFDAIGNSSALNTQMVNMGCRIFNNVIGIATDENYGTRASYACWGKGQRIVYEDGSAYDSIDRRKACISRLI
jgi:hypothetical protein